MITNFNQVTIPNIAQVIGTHTADPGPKAVIAAARSNPELASALEALDGYTVARQRIERVQVLAEQWTTQAQTAIAGANEHETVVAALDADDTEGLVGRLADARHGAEGILAALSTAAQSARALVAERDGIAGRADAILANLDTRLREVAQRHVGAVAKSKGATTAEAAITAGATKAWTEAGDTRETVRRIREAQSTVLRHLARDVFDRLATDSRYMLACAEVDDWQPIAPDLPQIIRHGGIWNTDKTHAKYGRQTGQLVQPMSVPWPDDRAARADWLLANHPERLCVRSLSEVEEGYRNLRGQVARCTPTGGQAEPGRLIGYDEITTRTYTGARR
ncbi:hypothetical protein [Janibacter indicus]|uniref:hypothetical protein n=1 Tax=Janibacter indicus TaxID=857417 RepID=UPI003EBEA1BC